MSEKFLSGMKNPRQTNMFSSQKGDKCETSEIIDRLYKS